MIRPLITVAAGLLKAGGVLAIEHDDTHGEIGARSARPSAGAGRRRRPPRPRRPPAVRHRAGGYDSPPHEKGVDMTIFDCADPLARRAGLETAAARGRAPAGSSCCRPTPSTASAPTRSTLLPCETLLAVKGRGPDMPVPGAGRVVDDHRRSGAARCSPVARELVEAFWPGGLSLVIEHAPSLQLGSGRHPGHGDAPDAAAPGRAGPATSRRADGRLQREPVAVGRRRRP